MIVTTTRRLRQRVVAFCSIAVILIAMDQITKYFALKMLTPKSRVVVIPNIIHLTLVRNHGASLGLGSLFTTGLAMLAIVACVALGVAVYYTTSPIWTVVLSFAFAGAFGNLIDRVVYAQHFLDGAVVDFINYGWSVGNIADVQLMIAALGIIVCSLMNIPFLPKKHNKDSHKVA